ncbi:phage tail tape measure protein [Gehongia tenuis]|uniref:Phage tail tape measure protein n=1 Tax=Gehongia tenuis TaxID=2763655 RepID=A0A926HQZ6_9FIRM|nr:phage tail tape measure protein [Gehongia tenuis]MBC8531756.1 phage tail tape measure protein [Gehongia tenuis]
MALKTIREAALKVTTDGEEKTLRTIKEINASLSKASSSLAKVNAQYGTNSKSAEALSARSKALTEKLEAQRERTERLRRELEDVKNEYGENSAEATKYEAMLARSEVVEVSLERQIRETNAELENQSNKWSAVARQCEVASGKLSAAGQKMSSIGNTMTLGLTTPLLAAGTAAVKTSINFESAFAGVRKTVDATDDQLKTLKQGIIDMSLEMPSSAVEIAAVAEAAGQLGIETDNILGFTRAMMDLSVATDIASSEGAVQLAQFANITQMSQKDFDRLGSTIVALGNNSATTESKILAMMQRLAGAGNQIGLSEAEIAGISAALASVGIEAEAGGSAFSKLFAQMQVAVETGNDSLGDFAAVAGMTAEEFKTRFQGDAAGAIVEFIDGLSHMSEEGMSSIGVLEEMGITELRLRDSLLRTSNAGDLVRESISLANSAWWENNALTKEAEQRYGTTESQLKILWNEILELARQMGDQMVPALREVIASIKPLIQNFNNLSTEQKANIIKWAGVIAAMGPMVALAGKITSGIGSVIGAFGKLTKIMQTTSALGTAGSGPAGWILMSVAALATLTTYLIAASDPLSNFREAMAGIKVEIDPLTQSLQGASAATIDMSKAVGESGRSLSELENEYTTIQTNINRISQETSAERRAALEEEIGALEELTGKLIEVQEEIIGTYETKQRSMLGQANAYANNMTKENAQMLVENAQGAREGVKEQLEKQRDDRLAYLQSEYEAGRLSQFQWERHMSDTVTNYERQLTETDRVYADTVSIVAQGYAKRYTVESVGLADLMTLNNNYSIAYAEYQAKLTTIDNDSTLSFIDKSQRKAAAQNDFAQKTKGWADQYATALQSMDLSTIQAFNAMIAAIEENGGVIEGEALGMARMIVDTFQNMPPELRAQGAEMMRQLGLGIDSNGNVVFIATETVSQEAADALNARLNSAEGRKAGENYAQGVADGMTSKMDSLVARARNMANMINSAFNKVLDIRSPSRKGAWSGSMWGAGVELGIESSRARIKRAVENIAAIPASMQFGVSPYSNLVPVASMMGRVETALAQPSVNQSRTVNIYQTNNISSPEYLSPGEAARKSRNELQKTALLWR